MKQMYFLCLAEMFLNLKKVCRENENTQFMKNFQGF